MNKVLISFYALNNDLENGRVSNDSPNYNLNGHFYNHDKHILLYTSEDHFEDVLKLVEKINSDYPTHKINPRLLKIHDVQDFTEIRDKLVAFLSEYKNDEIDIFMNPGTPQMQIAWFLLHVMGVCKSKLIQGRKAEHSHSGLPEFYIVNIENSSIPYAAILKYSYQNELTDYLITKSIKPIYQKAEKIALTDKVSVLIRGESGTGKEHLAKFIHDSSNRNDQPFITVNCSAIGDDLLESRLFGHKKGSFTGAVSDHIGFFEKADNGTLFLDEIGDISPRMQQSLLRVIQNDEIIPVGDNIERKINVRIITATNKNLEEMCEKGFFRWDLYYRLNVTELELPSLLERGREEIKELVKYFIRQKAIKFNKKPLVIDNSAMQKLLNYPFPGNIRELENIIENLYVFCDGKVKEADLPKRLLNPDKSKSLLLEDMIRTHSKYVLDLCNGNKTEASKKLGCSLNTLKKYLT